LKTYSKNLIAVIFLLILSIICFLCEKIFYDRIDENGYLQESFFLPLSFLFGFLSILFFLIFLVRKIIKVNSRRNKTQTPMSTEN